MEPGMQLNACQNDLSVRSRGHSCGCKLPISLWEEETLAGTKRNQLLRMIITTFGTNIGEVLPGISIKNTQRFVMKIIKFYMADPPPTLLC